MLRIIILTAVSLLFIASSGCESFLDEKPDKKLVVPATLGDLQAILDNHGVVANSIPNAGEVSADNYYLTDADWAALAKEEDRRMYTWEKDYLFPAGFNDWFYLYRAVYAANTVLETLPEVPQSSAAQNERRNIEGQALYVRASCFFHTAIIWAPAYNEGTAAADLGIPLRLGTDFHEKSERASLQQTFNQITEDLRAAVPLLPVTPVHVIRPSRAAAYGLLARTYLYMRQYEMAAAYADSSLQLQSSLMDYNALRPTDALPIPRFNQEVVLHSLFTGLNPSLANNRAKVDQVLYSSYAPDDLRKTIFFRNNGNGSHAFKGSYSNSGFFSGIATDEMYLTRAEALARLGKPAEALADLNTLLSKRWKAGTYVPFTAATREEAIQLILQERRKELLMRGLRWMDIKRLNLEGANITLTRTVNGQAYTLKPNDPRYALPIPEDVIALSGMPQNPR